MWVKLRPLDGGYQAVAYEGRCQGRGESEGQIGAIRNAIDNLAMADPGPDSFSRKPLGDSRVDLAYIGIDDAPLPDGTTLTALLTARVRDLDVDVDELDAIAQACIEAAEAIREDEGKRDGD